MAETDKISDKTVAEIGKCMNASLHSCANDLKLSKLVRLSDKKIRRATIPPSSCYANEEEDCSPFSFVEPETSVESTVQPPYTNYIFNELLETQMTQNQMILKLVSGPMVTITDKLENFKPRGKKPYKQ